MKRREFFTQSVGAGAAGMLAPAAFANTRAEGAGGTGSPERLSKGWFETLLDERFVFHQQGNESLVAKLVAVQVLPGSAKHEQFSLAFRIANGNFQGGFFEVEDAKGGRFPLMVSPGASLGPQQTYLAHFSLLKLRHS
jgi:hypothetical protein